MTHLYDYYIDDEGEYTLAEQIAIRAKLNELEGRAEAYVESLESEFSRWLQGRGLETAMGGVWKRDKESHQDPYKHYPLNLLCTCGHGFTYTPSLGHDVRGESLIRCNECMTWEQAHELMARARA